MLIRYSHTLTLTMLILLKPSKKYGHTCQQYAEALYLSYTGINADCHTGVFVGWHQLDAPAAYAEAQSACSALPNKPCCVFLSPHCESPPSMITS